MPTTTRRRWRGASSCPRSTERAASSQALRGCSAGRALARAAAAGARRSGAAAGASPPRRSAPSPRARRRRSRSSTARSSCSGRACSDAARPNARPAPGARSTIWSRSGIAGPVDVASRSTAASLITVGVARRARADAAGRRRAVRRNRRSARRRGGRRASSRRSTKPRKRARRARCCATAPLAAVGARSSALLALWVVIARAPRGRAISIVAIAEQTVARTGLADVDVVRASQLPARRARPGDGAVDRRWTSS